MLGLLWLVNIYKKKLLKSFIVFRIFLKNILLVDVEVVESVVVGYVVEIVVEVDVVLIIKKFNILIFF
jgi:hypothetical protein